MNPRPRRVSFLWYSMGWASSGAISTASLIFQIRAKTATALHWRGLRSVGRITPPALSAEIPPRRRITASGYSPYQAHVPHWKATLEGAPFRGANTPPALSAEIPPQRRITASGYSPYRPTCHAERPPEGGLSAWRPTPRALSAAYLRCFFIATRRRSIPITTGSWSEARYGSALYRLSCCRGVLNSTL